ncbi:hypothetical protein Pa4123_50830 [Phytohabitans aurantiacus]|uniref:Integrase catalytic domain-containing protein n=1 Tax=Phytohabitans aurantiacus TaxID=3016789 RepID=A0ABQ5QZ31_9ACTN|nr:hypothetical protein Pa4123_50830 [Phytohabitans aurantiacus]
MDVTVAGIGSVVVAESRAAGYMESTIGQYRKSIKALTDRGSRYTSAEFRATLTRLRMRAPMGRVGPCLRQRRRRVALFATLKAEIGTRVWVTRRRPPGRVRLPRLLQPRPSTLDT